MPKSNMTKRVAICSLTTLMCTAGTGVFAHTTVRDAVTEGTRSFNAFSIPHGCSGIEEDPNPLEVRGQSAVLPFGDSAVWIDLSTGEVIITGGEGIVDGDLIDLGVAGIQDDSLFDIQTEETDALENVRALNWKKGALHIDLLGLTQFRVSGPIITDACVSALRVRIAVANWCERGANEANDADNNRADWWFTGGTGSTKFVDPEMLQEDFWTTLTVENPDADPTGCPGGVTHEVAVQPSGADIDEFLPYAPFTADPAPY